MSVRQLMDYYVEHSIIVVYLSTTYITLNNIIPADVRPAVLLYVPLGQGTGLPSSVSLGQ